MISPEGTSPERLGFSGLSVRFGSTVALDAIELSFAPGEIVGLLGHNGAGKSTLLNVATGAVPRTEGSMRLDGDELPEPVTPGRVAGLGIAVIHQEPALAPNLSVFDNLYLASGDTSSRSSRRARARAALDAVGARGIGLDSPVGMLPLGNRQIVDLVRAQLRGHLKVLLLDEPTAALGEAETRVLHRLIRELSEQGTTIVYVSHRLPDIIDVCRRVVVLQGGAVVMDSPVEGLDSRDLSHALAPQVDLEASWESTAAGPGLELGSPFGISCRAGEIVGLYGIAAGPQFRILEQLYGLRSGAGPVPEATLAGSPLSFSAPAAAIARGVHYVPADRERDGLIAGMSALDNVYLPWRGRLRMGARAAHQGYAEARETYNILGPSGDAAIAAFSGGNRQKHLLARWTLPRRPELLLLAQPTQGVDVGAKVDIRRALRGLAAAGTPVLVASSESDEIASMCDRAYVVTGDRAVPVERDEHMEENLLRILLESTPNESAA
ncbi:ATP-binding cassette domain-containing protein [Herbiconiux moechotypicola]|uniref:Sugar ABC transporter ATP-binding protein n=1 Tax=Herbiconiux moechotypicola TaxID=637393 RepID=A0ABN3E258_9MICO|nr:ATP-binding cassette domain-containing protein [Herbiconiux moechotypicola]MCS5731321.1 ATP-binding cassette domain-containing protein [Herbiconiux moechotypicola]